MARISTGILVTLFVSGCTGEVVREDEVADAVSSTEQALRACAGANTVEGIDVSSYQPNTTWSQVAAAGKKFAIIKATEGTGYVNASFARDWSGAKGAGLIRGAYHFFRPTTNAVAQADHFVDTMGALGVGDLPGMLDLEVTDGLGPAAVAAATKAFLDRVEARTGRKPLIYTGYYFWTGSVGDPPGYGDYPLVMAAYVSGCPLIPNEWAKFTIWQYSSSGSVPGVTTNVDLDRFNGTLAELQALASPPHPPNRTPIGFLDVADGATVAGWAQDPDAPTLAIDAHVYFNGPAGSPTAHGVPLHANQSRADLCAPLGSCAHGFSMHTPQSLCDGQGHQVHLYGIDSAGGRNPELGTKTLTCSVTPRGAKRHVIDEPSLTAWGFTFFDDVAPVTDAVLASAPDTGDWPAAPVLVRADGDAMVWVLDRGFRRWVPNPSVAAAWHLDLSKVKVISAAELATSPRAADWRSAPLLVQGTGPAVYVIDDLLPLEAVVLPATSPAVVGEVLLPAQRVVGGCASTGLEAVLPFALLVLARRRGRAAPI
jgi:GH25 family lysozyme M1 (1,4-beta-N-acetylmuramidase)